MIPAFLRLPLCVTGIWSCFFYYGILQEGIFRYKSEAGEKFSQTLLLLIVEHGVSAFVSLVIVVLFGQNSGQSWSPFLKPQTIIAGAQCGAKFASNEALKHVSYPIQALAKSSKTLPAMFGCFFSGKAITVVQWCAAFGITAGTAGFSMGGKKSSGVQASAFGVGLLVISLMCDGTVASSQQALRSGNKKKLTAYEQMFMTNVGATLLLIPFAAFTGQLQTGLEYLMMNPMVLQNIGIFALCSAFGQVFIFLTIVWYGPDTNAKITTVRKMATVLISIVWYGHPIAQEQWLAVGLVFASVAAELLEQLLGKKKHAPEPAKKDK